MCGDVVLRVGVAIVQSLQSALACSSQAGLLLCPKCRLLMLRQPASHVWVPATGSSQANPFACIASGIAALWGPAHGGANEAVLSMLKTIGTKVKIPEALARAKDKSDPFRCVLPPCAPSCSLVASVAPACLPCLSLRCNA